MAHNKRLLIYVISAGPNGPCKVGYGHTPASRLKSMQVGNHLKLTLCSVWTSRHAKRTEQAIHHALGRRYIRGEWFDVSPDDAEAACLAAGATRTTQAEAIIDYTRKPTKASTRLDWLLGPNFIS